MDVSQIKM